MAPKRQSQRLAAEMRGRHGAVQQEAKSELVGPATDDFNQSAALWCALTSANREPLGLKRRSKSHVELL